jgi:DNA-binding XRE family transcriptional regulator
MEFAEQIRMIRQRMFLSQDEFAKVLHVSLSTVNRWEMGRSKPNLTAMKQIKEFCGENGLEYDGLESSWLSLNKADLSR